VTICFGHDFTSPDLLNPAARLRREAVVQQRVTRSGASLRAEGVLGHLAQHILVGDLYSDVLLIPWTKRRVGLIAFSVLLHVQNSAGTSGMAPELSRSKKTWNGSAELPQSKRMVVPLSPKEAAVTLTLPKTSSSDFNEPFGVGARGDTNGCNDGESVIFH
jgi:hypothetical protein